MNWGICVCNATAYLGNISAFAAYAVGFPLAIITTTIPMTAMAPTGSVRNERIDTATPFGRANFRIEDRMVVLARPHQRPADPRGLPF
jgi:hypothetical protein